MKKAFYIFCSLLISPLVGFGQISLSETSVNFGETNYKETTIKKVILSNQYDFEVRVKIKTSNADFIADDSVIIIAANGQKEVNIQFVPRHNINYDEEVVFVSNSIFGSISLDVKGAGKYSTYYASTFNLYEEDLKQQLKSVISAGYKNLGYNGARDAMYGSIDNKQGKVTCVYTGRVATFNSRSGANSNSFNCEHTWPQSLFNKNEPERADIHHLFPTDVNANGKRGSYPFGVVSSASWSEGGSKLGGGKFEPRDVHKGDVARAMFYFVTRYQNYSSFLTGQESTLRQWSLTFPPTTDSKNRNDAIFARQKNRNPYVDYPEFLERITSISTTSTATERYEITPSVTEIQLEKSQVKGQFVYHLELTNTGNQPVTFTNVSVSHSNLSVPGGNIFVQPGSSATLELTVTSDGSDISDVLTLTSSQVQLSIPIAIDNNVGVEPIGTGTSVVIRRSGTRLRITNALGATCQIYNGQGQLVDFTEIQSNFTEINLAQHSTGIYFVHVVGNGAGIRTEKVFVP